MVIVIYTSARGINDGETLMKVTNNEKTPDIPVGTYILLQLTNSTHKLRGEPTQCIPLFEAAEKMKGTPVLALVSGTLSLQGGDTQIFYSQPKDLLADDIRDSYHIINTDCIHLDPPARA